MQRLNKHRNYSP